MNETNVKHGYSLMVREARSANFKGRGRIYATRGAILNIEVRGPILGPPAAGFFNYVSPGGWICQVGNAFWSWSVVKLSKYSLYIYIEINNK